MIDKFAYNSFFKVCFLWGGGMTMLLASHHFIHVFQMNFKLFCKSTKSRKKDVNSIFTNSRTLRILYFDVGLNLSFCRIRKLKWNKFLKYFKFHFLTIY